jgi:hypothetical protein
MLRKGLGPASFKSALFGGLAVVAVLGIASWAFERGFYRPSVVQRGHVTVADGWNHVTASTRLLAIGRRSLWQVEVTPGIWRDCGSDCENALRKALAE